MKFFVGKVVSLKMAKTVVVARDSWRAHPLYKKLVKKTKRYQVHNENLEVKVGDKVKILETRPISKEKHFRAVEVVK